jgi:hypothetical protein
MERFVTLGNPRFSFATACNTFRQQKGHPEVAEMPMFIGFLRWLPFLNIYRTMCLAPDPVFRRVLQEIRELGLAA